MKKIAKLAVVLTALSLFFVGCQNAASTTDSESNIDVKTIKLATPKVTTVAYPGVNYIAWERVESAASYVVIRNDGTKLSTATGRYWATDDDLANDVTYKYTVWALAASETGNYAAYFIEHTDDVSVKSKNDIYDYTQLKSSKKTVSVKAIVPEYGTYALDACTYEKNGDKNYIVNKDNIKVVKSGDYIYVSYPTKAYLSYSSKLYRGNGKSLFTKYAGTTLTGASDDNDTNVTFYTPDATTFYTTPVTAAGEYFVGVTVSGTGFVPNEEITSTAKVTVEALDAATATSTPVVAYTDDTRTVARLSWTPAKKTDGSVWGTENYTVYTYDSTTATYTKLTDDTLTVQASTAASTAATTYYVDYTVPSNEVSYTFVVVLSDGDLYESTEKKATLSAAVVRAAAPAINTTTAYVAGTDYYANDIKWTITLDNANQTAKAYLLVKDNDSYSATLVRADFDESEGQEIALVTEDSVDGVTYYAYTSDVAKKAANAYLMVVVTEVGKLSNYAISSAVAIDDYAVPSIADAAISLTNKEAYEIATGNVAGTVKTTAVTTPANDVVINIEEVLDKTVDSIDNYTYAIYRAKATAEDATEYDFWTALDTWVKVSDLKLTAMYSSTGAVIPYPYDEYMGVYEEDNLAAGVYAYKVVKTATYDDAEYTYSQFLGYETVAATETTVFDVGATGKYAADNKSATVTFKLTCNDSQETYKVDGDGDAATLVIDDDNTGYIDDGWTYTLYSMAIDLTGDADVMTSATVITKLGTFTLKADDDKTVSATPYTAEIKDVTVSLTDFIDFTVVATKDGQVSVFGGLDFNDIVF